MCGDRYAEFGPLLCTIGAVLALFSGATAHSRADEPVDYTREIKPILQRSCYACHGVLQQKGKLRLDAGTLIRKGGDSGAAVEPGKADESELLARITSSDETLRMPLEGATLKPAEIDRIRQWIEQGAKFPDDDRPEQDPADHWAFRPIVRTPPPGSGNGNPIDAFLNAKLTEKGITAAGTAEPGVWLRRVTIDLTGLPPMRQELAAFAADDSPLARARVVDRLLASPQYGERWGRHWMDIWRYSDWWGLGAEVRNSQKHMWHWRDWIVESLNADKPYDQMVREMLAADELYPNDLDRLRASGFMARQYFKFNRTSWLDETVEHTSKAFLGLTLNCCKCHDHKFDPFTQDDYYSWRAVFEPYQVRLDQLPGQSDLEQDGLPRAFDCHLDAPTWLHIRGDDRRPDKDHPLSPRVPELFSRMETGEFAIAAVSLPAEAWQPGLRPYVLDNALKAADGRIAESRTARQKAEKVLAAARMRASETDVASKTDPAGPLVKENFAAENAERWQTVAGEWTYADGKLTQRQDGDVRGILRLKSEAPADFEAKFRFSTTGGKTWKSVGITFDATDASEALVYLSAYAGGPKLQACYRQGAGYTYPTEGVQSREVPLNQPQELLVRVRGNLINASVNGGAPLAYRLPIERKTGRMELITFDAQAEFLGFELSALPQSTVLIDGKSGADIKPVEQAELELAIAKCVLAGRELEPSALRSRAAADAVVTREPNTQAAAEAVRSAVQAERKLAASQAEENVFRAKLELMRAETSKREPAEQKLKTAEDALAAALKAAENPEGAHTPLVGGLKTLESPTETEAERRKPFPPTSTGRRTALARWITDPKNPLTARVAVNHIWARHFGQPLVPSVFDFGRRAPRPEHAELLDFLARELIDSGWSMKHLHRLMLTSEAYRRTSSNRDASPQIAADPENRLYWRMNPIRMESEVVRDTLLALAGNLDLRLGGPSVDPAKEPRPPRRSLYFVHSHNDHHPFLSMFDDASVLDCYRRQESIVPQQALALSNSALALAAAEKINERLHAQLGAVDDMHFGTAAFETILAEQPSAEELAACQALVSEVAEKLKAANQPNPGVRARRALIQALLNHNDFVTIR
ncbi:MAG TPA: PSD1 and planctomycete cytochrome C domain-containing protein [Planctomycetaceae bacterium]|nr:PSD1 and planctomycete cytochrome C domain-containing protein [Planctomycetaceae bacterium]